MIPGRFIAVLSMMVLTAAAIPASSQDLAHVSDEEIAQEIVSRDADILRTSERVEDLEQAALDAGRRLDGARMEVLESERVLARNAALLYRFSRNGKALRYLFASSSAVGFLRRIHILRHLVVSGLESQRESGLRLAEAESDVTTNAREIEMAREMLGRLEENRRELIAERSRRSVSEEETLALSGIQHLL